MRIPLLALVVACGVIAGVSPQAHGPFAQAQEGQKAGEGEASRAPRMPFKWWASEQYMQELKLTPEQSAEIEKVFQLSMDRLRADKGDFDRAQANFSLLMERASVSDREFQRAVDRLEMARYYVSKERTLMLVRIHNLLTPEQRKGIEAMRNRHGGDSSPH